MQVSAVVRRSIGILDADINVSVDCRWCFVKTGAVLHLTTGRIVITVIMRVMNTETGQTRQPRFLMSELTKIQASILQFIAEFQKKEGRSPAGTEVQQRFGYNHHSTARQHLHALERKGFIELARGGHGIPYHIRLLPPAFTHVDTEKVPIVGSIAAGTPTEAIAQSNEWVERIDDLLSVSTGDFLLRVRGESMIGEGILPGDVVLIRPQKTIERGEIAAVMVGEDDATLKRIYMEPPDNVRLVPSNPTMQDMIYPASDVRIIGRYQGLIRTNPQRPRR